MGGLFHGVRQVASGRQMPEATAVLCVVWGPGSGRRTHELGAHELGRVQEWSAFPPAGMGRHGDRRQRTQRQGDTGALSLGLGWGLGRGCLRE